MKKLALVLLLAATALFAEETTRLPFNPWEKAQEGDWETLTVETKFEGETAEKAKGALRPLELVTYRIRGGDEREVKVGFDTVPEILPEDARIAAVYSRSETPAFDRLLDVKGTLESVKMTDEKHAVLGRELPCTKIAYTLITSRGVKAENVVWFSKDVKTFGLVEFVNVIPLARDSRITVTFRLAGFGSKDKVDMGKKPEDLVKKK